MWARAAGSLALLATVAGFAPACRQIAGIHPRASQETLCSQCVTDSCGPQVSACDSSTCATRLDCALACDPTTAGDASCQASCAAASVADAPGIAAIDSCVAGACSDACGVQCGGALPLTPPVAAPACASCVAANCCAEASACAKSVDCLSALECARGESTPDTVETCLDAKYAAGSSAYHAFDGCVTGSCVDACAVGADWSCVGKVTVPAPTTDTIGVALTAVQSTAQSVPVPGLQVVGCEADDSDCVTPSTPVSTTDQDGVASLRLPTLVQSGRAPFSGYIQLSDPSGTFAPDLVYVVPFLTQDGSAAKVIVSQPAEAGELGAYLMTSYDPTKGALIVTGVDCANQTAPDLSFDVTADATPLRVFYEADGLPSTTAQATDATGTALVLNIPIGEFSVAMHGSSPATAIATVQILSRAGALTILRVGPSR